MPNFFINVKEKGAKKAASSIGSLTKSLGAMAIAAVGVTKVIEGLKTSITMSAEMEGVKRGFDNLAKSSGFSTNAFNKFKTATDGTIDSLTLMKQANNAMLLGITDSEDQMAQMFDVAQRLGQSLGIDTVQSIESLVTGLGRQCLTSDSFISTKDGMKQIVDIKEGDIVLSYKEGKIIETEVTHLHNNGIQPTYIVTFKDGKYIKSTDNHRYLTDNGWQYLSELDSGSKILNIDNEYSEIHSINSFGEEEVYDLTVPETANFFANGLCVHNSKLMLDNLGIMVDTNGAYEDYASSIGKTTSQLTDQERKTAFVNAAMSEANSLVKQLGDEQLTTKDALAQVSTAAGELAVIFGDKLGKSIRSVSKHLIGIMKNVEGFIDWADGMNTVAEAQDRLSTSSEVLERIAKHYDIIGESSEFLTSDIMSVIDQLIIQIKEEEKLDVAYSRKTRSLGELREELIVVSRAEALKAESTVEADIRTESSTETTGGYLDALVKVAVKNADIVVSNNKLAESYKALQLMSEGATKSIALSSAQQSSAMINTGKAMEMAAQQAVAGEIQKVVAVQIGKIVSTVPFPFNIALAAAGGAAIGSLMTQSVRQFAKIGAATGADFVTSGPQMMMVGDNPSGQERVQVTPLGGDPNINGPQGGAVTVNVSGNVMTQDFVETDLAEAIREAARRGTDFGVS